MSDDLSAILARLEALEGAPKPGKVVAIVARAAEALDVPAEALYGTGRSQTVALARMLAMWLIRKHTGRSLSETGGVFGRCHSTVFHALAAVSDRMATDPSFRALVAGVEAGL